MGRVGRGVLPGGWARPGSDRSGQEGAAGCGGGVRLPMGVLHATRSPDRSRPMWNIHHRWKGPLSMTGQDSAPEWAPGINKRQVNVRFDARTRAVLQEVATGSDRQVSQLVRYAVADWIADEDRGYPLVAADGPSTYVNVRLDADLYEALDAICDETGVSRSLAIRCAVRLWLARVTGQDSAVLLGAPQAFTRGGVA